MRTIITAIICILACTSYGQDPVQWNFTAKKLKDKTYEVHLTASINEGWHVFSQTQPKEGVADPTKIVFTKNPVLVISGQVKEVGKKELYELKSIGIKQYQYADQVDFVQVINLKSPVKTNLAGSVTWQACNNDRCIPARTTQFTIPLTN